MKDWVNEHKISLISALLLAAVAIYYFYFYNTAQPAISSLDHVEESLPANPKKAVTDTKELPQKIIVDVKGQIKHPGVYQSSTEERVMDVITRAGGLTDKADENQVNFAEHVHDEMVIYIPAKGEEPESQAGVEVNSIETAGNTAESQGKIDLNKADVNQLQNLPGIGPAKAKAIIEYREKSGKFKAAEDLKNISGIGDKTFDKLKDLIVVH
jgi:competence protein ComEA